MSLDLQLPRDIVKIIVSFLDDPYEIMGCTVMNRMFYEEAKTRLDLKNQKKGFSERWKRFYIRVSSNPSVERASLENPMSVISTIVLFSWRINKVTMCDDELRWSLKKACEQETKIPKDLVVKIDWGNFPSKHYLSRKFIEENLDKMGFSNVVMKMQGKGVLFEASFLTTHKDQFRGVYLQTTNKITKQTFINSHKKIMDVVYQLFGDLLYHEIYHVVIYDAAKFKDFIPILVKDHEDSWEKREWEEMKTVRSCLDKNFVERMRRFGRIKWA